jgi:adenylosuccinate lyase
MNKSNKEDFLFGCESITPIDGKYSSKTKTLSKYFSDYALTKYRLFIEIKYFIKLSETKLFSLSKNEIIFVENIYKEFNFTEYSKIKTIEGKTLHDIKAIEYYLRQKFEKSKINKRSSFIHWGITSEDINNLTYSLILKNFNSEILFFKLKEIIDSLTMLVKSSIDMPILARTHGQPAVATTFGKEIGNYIFRLKKQKAKIQNYKFEGKLNGAVGNFNSMDLICPEIDWIKFSKNFISSLGLNPNIFTTQILHYDNYIEYFQIVNLTNGILLDLSTNIWNYIMLGILKQKKLKGEVGSSTMPQKINPINFENAEGNLQLANSLLELFSRKLVTSRLQRDLSDSTVRRSFGSAFAYSIIAWQSLILGLQKISINEEFAKEELNNHWEILSEPLQTYLKIKGDEKAYETLKNMTQGKIITKEIYLNILDELKITEIKFRKLTPEKYLGLSKKLTKQIINFKNK